jgi:hypothetical protein
MLLGSEGDAYHIRCMHIIRPDKENVARMARAKSR